MRTLFLTAAIAAVLLPTAAFAQTADPSPSPSAMHGAAMKGNAMKGDHMKGDAMKGDAMKGDHMKGGAMKPEAP